MCEKQTVGRRLISDKEEKEKRRRKLKLNWVGYILCLFLSLLHFDNIIGRHYSYWISRCYSLQLLTRHGRLKILTLQLFPGKQIYVWPRGLLKKREIQISNIYWSSELKENTRPNDCLLILNKNGDWNGWKTIKNSNSSQTLPILNYMSYLSLFI